MTYRQDDNEEYLKIGSRSIPKNFARQPAISVPVGPSAIPEEDSTHDGPLPPVKPY